MKKIFITISIIIILTPVYLVTYHYIRAVQVIDKAMKDMYAGKYDLFVNSSTEEQKNNLICMLGLPEKAGWDGNYRIKKTNYILYEKGNRAYKITCRLDTKEFPSNKFYMEFIFYIYPYQNYKIGDITFQIGVANKGMGNRKESEDKIIEFYKKNLPEKVVENVLSGYTMSKAK
jgi:hypothetical protein